MPRCVLFRDLPATLQLVLPPPAPSRNPHNRAEKNYNIRSCPVLSTGGVHYGVLEAIIARQLSAKEKASGITAAHVN